MSRFQCYLSDKFTEISALEFLVGPLNIICIILIAIMAKKTGKNKGKGQGAKKRKARIADLDNDIVKANKRAHLQSRKDTDLFVIDNKPGLNQQGSRRATHSTVTLTTRTSSSAIPNVPTAFENAPTRVVLPGVAKNLQNQMHSSKRVGGDRHRQGVKQVEASDLYDVWGDDTALSSSSNSSDTNQHFPSSSSNDSWTESLVKKPAVRHSKKFQSSQTRLTAADVVSEGASYNPEAGAHAELVAQVKADKLMRARKLAVEKAQLHPPAPATDPSLLDSDNEEDQATEGEQILVKGSIAAARFKATSKKTTQQRNKQARSKALALELVERRTKKSTNSQLAHLKEIKKSVKLEEKTKLDKKERLEQWKAAAALEPAPLKYGGKISKMQPKLAVVDARSLPTNMRSLQTVGNPVIDRMQNMLRRNVMEQGKKVRMRKPKQKKLERNRGWKLDVEESDDEEEY